MTKPLSLLAAIAVTLAAVVVGWRSFEAGPGDTSDPPRSAPSSEPTPVPSETADPSEEPSVEAAVLPRPPEAGSCHRMAYSDAVAPTASRRTVRCSGQHTSVTFAVDELDTVVDGHLVTVDTERVRDQVARECPARFERYVGGTLEQRRLSLLRPVGFSPSVEQSDRGASWLRCDVVAVAEGTRLAPLGPDLEGVLDTPEGRTRYGRCATAGPGDRDFRTVICAEQHSWRAVRTVTFPEGRYPGTATVRDAGTRPCRAAGRDAAGDALDFEWGYEWPTAERWRQGRTFGICWVPD